MGLSARTKHRERRTARTLAGSVLENSTCDPTSRAAGVGVHNGTAASVELPPRTSSVTTVAPVCGLRELIAALDRRLPQVEPAGGAAIARDAAALKATALERSAALEN